MNSYEYTVIPAPARAGKASPGKTSGERFAATLAEALNGMAAEGWEYVRAEVLPAEERAGLTGRSTVYHNLLVFRRALAGGPDGARQMPATRTTLVGEATGALARGAGGQPGAGEVAGTAPPAVSDGRDAPRGHPPGLAAEAVAPSVSPPVSPPVAVPDREGRDHGAERGAGDGDGQAGRRVADAPARPAAQPGLAAPVRTPFSRTMPAPAQQAPAAASRSAEPPLTRPRPAAPALSGWPRLGPASR